MPRKKTKEACCDTSERNEEYRVEAVVSVDQRGQMVLPKDIRQKLGVNGGDKLALVIMERNGKVCCVNMFKAEELADKVRSMIGPLMNEKKG